MGALRYIVLVTLMLALPATSQDRYLVVTTNKNPVLLLPNHADRHAPGGLDELTGYASLAQVTNVAEAALAAGTNAIIVEATNRVAQVGYLLPASTQGLATVTYVDTATNNAVIDATNRVAGVGYLLPASTNDVITNIVYAAQDGITRDGATMNLGTNLFVLTNSAGARITVANTNAATASVSDTEVYTAKATEQAINTRAARLAQSNIFSAGTTQTMDRVVATNVVVVGQEQASTPDFIIYSDPAMTSATFNAYTKIAIVGSYLPAFEMNQTGSGLSIIRPVFFGTRACGTPASLAAVTNGFSVFSLLAQPYDGFAYRNPSEIDFVMDGVVSSNVTPMAVRILTGTSSSRSERMRITSTGDMRLYNLAAGANPTMGSGYSGLASKTNELYAFDGAGNLKLLTPHNSSNEMVSRSENIFSGEREEVNLTYLARAVESLLAKDDPLKGKIYSIITNTPAVDWRENEKRQELERAAQIQQWEASAEKEGAKPDPYTARPIPVWAEPAQRTFDSKYLTVEK